MDEIDLKKWTVKHGSNYIVFVPHSPSKSYHKYTAWVLSNDGKVLHRVKFGDSRYQHYKDSTPTAYWSHLDHNDNKRRSAYRKRHSAIKTKSNTPAYKKEYSPAWFSYYYLW